MGVLPVATAGIQAATQRFETSAARTVRAFTPEGADVDLAQEAVEQIGAKVALKANVSVMRTADEMMGTLLDILA